MKRIILFLLTNLAVTLVLSITLSIFGVNNYLTAKGISYQQLFIFALIVGFTCSIISLLMSKSMAKMSTGARVINPNAPSNSQEAWLLETVRQLADRAQITMPEVAIYEGAPNAFATGAFKNSSLVAVSTGLLQSMNEEEISAVLAHEISHVSNGDMVTLTLIQGVVNTFVIFFARIVGNFIDRTIFRNEQRGNGIGYYAVVFVCEIIFGIIASIIVAWFSRYREFRADAGSARLLGSTVPMIKALKRLQQMQEQPHDLPKQLNAMGITGKVNIAALFASHPPLEVRIQSLQSAEAKAREFYKQ